MSANVEMINALEVLEKEKNIPREVIILIERCCTVSNTI